jgi:hypothetical protein
MRTTDDFSPVISQNSPPIVQSFRERRISQLEAGNQIIRDLAVCIGSRGEAAELREPDRRGDSHLPAVVGLVGSPAEESMPTIADQHQHQPYDRSSKWLIQHHGDSILRLARVEKIEAWRPAQAEVSIVPRWSSKLRIFVPSATPPTPRRWKSGLTTMRNCPRTPPDPPSPLHRRQRRRWSGEGGSGAPGHRRRLVAKPVSTVTGPGGDQEMRNFEDVGEGDDGDCGKVTAEELLETGAFRSLTGGSAT